MRSDLPEKSARALRAWGGARAILAALCLAWTVTACQSNNCQDLCTSYYQMELRCDLFGQESGQLEAACQLESEDPQTLKQRAEYDIRQCRQDFRYPSCREQTTCCKNVCFELLQQTYDATSGTDEASVDQRRDLCRKYHSLVKAGDASWCTSLQQSCIAEQATCSE